MTPGDGVREAINGPEQVALFEEDTALIAEQFGSEPEKRRGGRAKGAKNRATRDVIRYCREVYTDPLMAMGEISTMTIDQVMKSFGFAKRPEAAEFWRKVLVDYKNTLYPGTTLADALKEAVEQGVPVLGMFAMASAQRGAPPDISGDAIAAKDTSPRPITEDEEKQLLSQQQAAQVAQTQSRTDEPSD